MIILFLIASILSVLIGLVFLTKANIGIGLICFACLMGIFARIAQAEKKGKLLPEKNINTSKEITAKHWQCPKCNNANPIDIYTCSKCGYKVE